MLQPSAYMSVTIDTVIDMWIGFQVKDVKDRYLQSYLNAIREGYLNDLSSWEMGAVATKRPYPDEQARLKDYNKRQTNLKNIRAHEQAVQKLLNKKLVPPHQIHWVQEAEERVLLSLVCQHPPFDPRRHDVVQTYYEGIERLNPRNA